MVEGSETWEWQWKQNGGDNGVEWRELKMVEKVVEERRENDGVSREGSDGGRALIQMDEGAQ